MNMHTPSRLPDAVVLTPARRDDLEHLVALRDAAPAMARAVTNS